MRRRPKRKYGSRKAAKNAKKKLLENLGGFAWDIVAQCAKVPLFSLTRTSQSQLGLIIHEGHEATQRKSQEKLVFLRALRGFNFLAQNRSFLLIRTYNDLRFWISDLRLSYANKHPRKSSIPKGHRSSIVNRQSQIGLWQSFLKARSTIFCRCETVSA